MLNCKNSLAKSWVILAYAIIFCLATVKIAGFEHRIAHDNTEHHQHFLTPETSPHLESSEPLNTHDCLAWDNASLGSHVLGATVILALSLASYHRRRQVFVRAHNVPFFSIFHARAPPIILNPLIS